MAADDAEDERRRLSRAVVATIRIRMSEQGMSAYRLHKVTGVAQTTISGWLRDLSAPGIDDLGRIAGALGTTPGALLEEAVTRTELDTT